MTRYRLTGKISVRLPDDWPYRLIKPHEEVVEADTPEEALARSLSALNEEEEDPVWNRGYPQIKEEK